jgi:hypothetical protein
MKSSSRQPNGYIIQIFWRQNDKILNSLNYENFEKSMSFRKGIVAVGPSQMHEMHFDAQQEAKPGGCLVGKFFGETLL